MKTILRIVGCWLLFGFLVAGASAFPLSGGNGQVNATVFGVVKSNGITYVDVAIRGMPFLPKYDFQLIDADDKAYSAPDSGMNKWMTTFQASDGYNRGIAQFTVPDEAIIKRIRIAPYTYPDASDPFSIDWTGVPEISDDRVTLKFYGGSSSTTVYTGDLGPLFETRTFDIKLTNLGKETLGYSNDEFYVIDQFGWRYNATQAKYGDKLLPGESLRFGVRVKMCQLSRPVTLGFDDLKMDISAWA